MEANDNNKNPNENVVDEEKSPEQQQQTISDKLREIFSNKEGLENLYKIGDLMYESFSGEEYSPAIVIESLSEIYHEQKEQFDPPLTFDDFIRSYGPGLVKLCQMKLVTEGGYNLGKYGPAGDGIDGLLGRMTSSALRQFFEKRAEKEDSPNPDETTPSQEEPVPSQEEPTVSPQSRPPEIETAAPKETEWRTEKPTISDKLELEDPIKAEYARHNNRFNAWRMKERFGDRYEKVKPYITTIDPKTNKPLTFLGRLINGGMNLLAIPFLAIVKDKLEKMGLQYEPVAKELGGFSFRNMNIIGKPRSKPTTGRLDPTLPPSSHAFGMAIDIDADKNKPTDGRGNIPDQVAMAFIESGWIWGLVGTPDHGELGADPMHFQAPDPRTPEAMAIIKSSEVGSEYWELIQHLLPPNA